MRKWIGAGLAAGLVLIVAPWLVGLWFQYQYQELVAVANAKGHVAITMTHYHRRWFSSNAELHIRFLDPGMTRIGAENGKNPVFEITVNQTIMHGPVFYRDASYLPSFFGWVSIDNVIQLSPDMQKWMQFSQAIYFRNIDVLTLSGNYFSYFSLPAFMLTQADSDLHFNFNDGLTGKIWLRSDMQHVRGELSMKDFVITDEEGVATHLSDFTASSFIDESAKKLHGTTQIDIKKLMLGEQETGPLHIEFDVSDLEAGALADLITAYKTIFTQGELYQSQLQQKISTMVPQIFSKTSEIRLAALNLQSATGQLEASGSLSWPGLGVPSANIGELWDDATGEANVEISKSLVDTALNYMAQLPNFRSFSPEKRRELLDLEKSYEAANQRNYLFIVSLVNSNQLKEEVALELLALQKHTVPVAEYFSALKTLFLNSAISREMSYTLFWQYLAVREKVSLFEQLFAVDQQSVKSRLRTQFDQWVKEGYIKQERGHYKMTIQKENGAIRLNGKEI